MTAKPVLAELQFLILVAGDNPLSIHDAIAAVPTNTIQELVQDLNDLTVVCRIWRETLYKTRFDRTLEEKSALLCKELEHRIAQSILLREHLANRIIARNEACRKLYQLVVAICRIGKTAFPDDPRARDCYYKY